MGRAFPQASPAQITSFTNRFVGRGLDPSAGRLGRRPLLNVTAYFPAGFSFIIIPSKYTPYIAIAAALTGGHLQSGRMVVNSISFSPAGTYTAIRPSSTFSIAAGSPLTVALNPSS